MKEKIVLPQCDTSDEILRSFTGLRSVQSPDSGLPLTNQTSQEGWSQTEELRWTGTF